jgi:hypothetical protein
MRWRKASTSLPMLLKHVVAPLRAFKYHSPLKGGDYMPHDDQTYFAQRAAVERRKAEAAGDPRAAAAHARLAELHEQAEQRTPASDNDDERLEAGDRHPMVRLVHR